MGSSIEARDRRRKAESVLDEKQNCGVSVGCVGCRCGDVCIVECGCGGRRCCLTMVIELMAELGGEAATMMGTVDGR